MNSRMTAALIFACVIGFVLTLAVTGVLRDDYCTPRTVQSGVCP